MKPRWLLFLLLLLAALPAHAMESPAVSSKRATVSVVTDTDAYAPDRPFRIGLRLRLAPGWYTYWKNPGDAGAAPDIRLTLPHGVTAGAPQFPAPERISEPPLMVYGYHVDVLLPLTVMPHGTSGPLDLKIDADWLVCSRICVPEQGSFRLELPQGHPAPSAEAKLFAAADARMPRTAPFHATIAPDGTLLLQGKDLSARSVHDAWFLPDAAGAIDNAARQRVSAGEGWVSLHLTLGQAHKPGSGIAGVAELVDGGSQTSAWRIDAAPAAAAPPGRPGLPWIQSLGFAFLAGLILNLMPCVFPVLAMKALALARLSGAARSEVRAQALSYTAGVLVAFAVLGGLLLGLRTAGTAAGWGFQFQSPLFVAAMAWLLFCVGLGFSGVFAIGGRLAGAGQVLATRNGHTGSFFTGLLAVVVATPCTAPFMGAAIAAALAAPAPAALSVFLAMGVGLAAPYAAFAAAPSLARALPRPGDWMETTKQILAFPMYGASAWLVWVISQEAGPAGVLAVVAGFVLLGFAAWAIGRAQGAGHNGRRVLQACAAAAVLLALAVLPGLATMRHPQAALLAPNTEKFSAARLAALRQQGKPVFVDMTAAWCVTCLVNERVALEAPDVRQAFAARGIVYLRGDWTQQDPEITAFLHAHSRDGVPLYVYYPPAGGSGQVLPQLLTPGLVLHDIGAG